MAKGAELHEEKRVIRFLCVAMQSFKFNVLEEITVKQGVRQDKRMQ
jgi:hypothetical protein